MEKHTIQIISLFLRALKEQDNIDLEIIGTLNTTLQQMYEGGQHNE